MKLLRYGPKGKEKPGLIDEDGKIRDISKIIKDITPATIGEISKLKKANLKRLPVVKGKPRIGACVNGFANFFCIGLNYADHAAETGSALPEKPIVFLKSLGAVTGPTDSVPIPRGSTTTDWEVELGVIIGRKGKYIDEKNAMSYVAGYCTVNDVSERRFQGYLRPQTHWLFGKGCDGFGPIGPYFVTKDEVKDPHNLKLWCEVSGTMRQNGSTSTMIFKIPQLIAFISKHMTIYPGDIISTGTPPGVGSGIKPEPIYLKGGDVMKTGVEGLGEQKTRMTQDK